MTCAGLRMPALCRETYLKYLGSRDAKSAWRIRLRHFPVNPDLQL